MQEKQILKHTKRAVEQLTPDCFDAIWERASNASPEEYPLPTKSLPSKKASGTTRRWIAGFSVLAACMLCFFGFRWYENYAIYTTINLDVNPSIRICINRQEKIVSMTGLNEDGKKVVNALESPTHRPLDDVVEETVVELAEAGYFEADDANAILISVDTENSSNAEELMESLSKQVSATMGKKEIYGEVISQQMPRNDKEVERLANELHISNGKATLIRNMASENRNFSEKDLADMRINEILETAEKERVDMSSFEQPARLRAVPAPENAPVSSTMSDKKESSGNGKNSGTSEQSNPKDMDVQSNSSEKNSTTKQGSSSGSGNQQKVTEASKTTEKPKTTTAPKTDDDKKKNDSGKQKDNQKEPEESEKKETAPDERDSSGESSSTASPSNTPAPEPTSGSEDRGKPPRRTPSPRYPENPHDENRK